MDRGVAAVRRRARLGAGWCLIVAPVVLVSSTSYHPRIVQSQTEQLAIAAQDPGRWALSHAGITVAVLLLTGGLLGLAYGLRAHQPRTAFLAAVLMVPGFATLVGYLALHGFAEWHAARAGDQVEMAALMERIFDSPGVLVTFVAGPLIAALGVTVLMAGMYRGGLVNAWTAVLVAGGLSVNGLGATVLLGSSAVFVGGSVAALIALVPLGVRVLGASDEEFSSPPVRQPRVGRLAAPGRV